MKLRILFAALIAFGAYQHLSHRPVAQPEGVLVGDAPLQREIAPGTRSFTHGDYAINALAEFRLKARVLRTERYRLGREADLSPVDFALGWGPMSDSSVLQNIDITQSNRFYFWRASQLPIPRQDIVSHSANMHMIPADDSIRRQLLEVREGQVIALDGYLVRVNADDGWHWSSSLSRTDSGNGACELVWVERVRVL
jgi:hypothetical protein